MSGGADATAAFAGHPEYREGRDDAMSGRSPAHASPAYLAGFVVGQRERASFAEVPELRDWAAVPAALIRELDPSFLRTYLGLLLHGGEQGCVLSLGRLRELVGLSERQIRVNMKWLAGRGYIETVPVRAGTPNAYRCLVRVGDGFVIDERRRP